MRCLFLKLDTPLERLVARSEHHHTWYGFGNIRDEYITKIDTHLYRVSVPTRPYLHVTARSRQTDRRLSLLPALISYLHLLLTPVSELKTVATNMLSLKNTVGCNVKLI